MRNETIASTLTREMCRRGIRRNTSSVFVVVLDGDTAHALTESHLDTWWHAQTPEAKAEIYEATLGDGVERCRFCGCTDHKACVTDGQACAWLDPHHTVCSAPVCAGKYRAQLLMDLVLSGKPGNATHLAGTIQEVHDAAL
jgi:hypothetical protein